MIKPIKHRISMWDRIKGAVYGALEGMFEGASVLDTYKMKYFVKRALILIFVLTAASLIPPIAPITKPAAIVTMGLTLTAAFGITIVFAAIGFIAGLVKGFAEGFAKLSKNNNPLIFSFDNELSTQHNHTSSLRSSYYSNPHLQNLITTQYKKEPEAIEMEPRGILNQGGRPDSTKTPVIQTLSAKTNPENFAQPFRISSRA